MKFRIKKKKQKGIIARISKGKIKIEITLLKRMIKAHKKHRKQYEEQRDFWQSKIIRQTSLIKEYEATIEAIKKCL